MNTLAVRTGNIQVLPDAVHRERGGAGHGEHTRCSRGNGTGERDVRVRAEHGVRIIRDGDAAAGGKNHGGSVTFRVCRGGALQVEVTVGNDKIAHLERRAGNDDVISSRRGADAVHRDAGEAVATNCYR